MLKKAGFIFFAILLVLNLTSALNLEVSAKPVQNNFIVELNDSAVFDILIKNNGEGTNLRIYTAVGIDITPSGEFFIDKNQEKTIRINLIPNEALRQNKGPLVFEYIIQDTLGATKIDKLNINIISVADALSIRASDLTPDSKKINLTIKNILSKEVNNVFIKMDSAFFQYQTNISLKANEEKSIEIPLNTEKIKTLDAGSYIINTQIKINDKLGQKEVMVNFLQQENIKEEEIKSGFFIKKTEIVRRNIGNVRKVVSIVYETNLISSLFTSVSIAPTKKEIVSIDKKYLWEKELDPGQELRIVIKTNWAYPILAIVLIVILIFVIKRYLETDLIIKKKVYYVKTRGGEFALRVHLGVKAKRFVSKIRVIDKVPPLVMLYDKFGAIAPDKVDLINKRLEWDVEALNPGEEKVFSYIIYSKIGVVGKFELPPTKATYEKDGAIKTSYSNKSFFINKPRHSRM
jgi:hypothetical protein